MGRSAKGKEKKLRRKEDQGKINESVLAVREANKAENPFTPLVAFHAFSRNGLQLKIKCKNVLNMSEEEVSSTFKLVKDNMQLLYEKSSWGWNEQKKLNEMTEEQAKYLLAVDENDHIVAMCHFRFELDDGIEILYCYEIQLMSSIRGKGLGKFLMQILELMAIRAKMKKVVLTVFRANEPAVKFFKGMKYEVDCTSPSYDDPLEECDYEILSKSFNRT